MSNEFQRVPRSWPRKFRDAFRGAAIGIRRQNSFVVHTAFAGLAVLTAFLLGLTLSEWCLVMLCIAGVFAAEMFNSALESLAKAIDRQYNPHLADGLDIASAAVLISAAGAVVVGLLLFGTRLVGLMG